VRAARSGDQRAREQLTERFLSMVVSLARSFRVEGLEFADLVQEGVVGLLRALERFDPNRGVPFPAYAIWWVRYSLQELRELSRLKSEHERTYATEFRQPSLDEPVRAGRGGRGPVGRTRGRDPRRPARGSRLGRRLRGRPRPHRGGTAPRPPVAPDRAGAGDPDRAVRAGRVGASAAGGHRRAPGRERAPGPAARAAGARQARPDVGEPGRARRAPTPGPAIPSDPHRRGEAR
jgi:RNA polymerase sigma factor (sigma-70 family)